MARRLGLARADQVGRRSRIVHGHASVERFLFVTLDRRAARASACHLGAPTVLLDEATLPRLKVYSSGAPPPAHLQPATDAIGADGGAIDGDGGGEEDATGTGTGSDASADASANAAVVVPLTGKERKALETKAQVEEAKFGTAAALSRLGVDGFFLEMDVWLLRDPRPLFRAAAYEPRNYHRQRNQLEAEEAADKEQEKQLLRKLHDKNKQEEYKKRVLKEKALRTRPQQGVDVVISVHQENYVDLNVGFYWVQANRRTERLFDGMLQYLLINPDVWDQSLMCKLR